MTGATIAPLRARVWVAVLALSVNLTGGCSEAADAGGTGGADEPFPCGTGGGGSALEGPSTSSPSATTGGGGAAAGALVVNELSVLGDDWVELLNAGSSSLEVGGLRIADAAAPGEPKLDEAVTIPAGTVLEPGSYLFLLANQTTATEGFQADCAPGPSPCLVSTWGLSKDGDEVFVVAPDDGVLASAAYPAGATVDGESWGRLPDATGPFAPTPPTPGGPNTAP